MDQRLKYNIIKLQEKKKTGKRLIDIGLGNHFLDMTPKGQIIKAKNQQMGLYQT